MMDDIQLELNGFSSQILLLDGHSYTVFIKRQVVQRADAPRLVIVSYLPNPRTKVLLKTAIASIRRYTDCPYELWVIDNNSPLENIEWLLEERYINLVFNRTAAPEFGSYANAIGLEIAVKSIDADSQYVMTLAAAAGRPA